MGSCHTARHRLGVELGHGGSVLLDGLEGFVVVKDPCVVLIGSECGEREVGNEEGRPSADPPQPRQPMVRAIRVLPTPTTTPRQASRYIWHARTKQSAAAPFGCSRLLALQRSRQRGEWVSVPAGAGMPQGCCH